MGAIRAQCTSCGLKFKTRGPSARYCPGCGGAVAEAAGEPAADASNGYRCPTCPDSTLDIQHRRGIEIDVCPRCRGVWLDRDELEKLIECTNDTFGTLVERMKSGFSFEGGSMRRGKRVIIRRRGGATLIDELFDELFD